MILTAYVILLGLPVWAMLSGSSIHFEALPMQMPTANWFSLAIFGQMAVGGLSGFEYVAIMAGECRSAARTIGQSVIISAPIIAVMFILGTSTVLAFLGNQPINVIGPIPQTFRAAFGTGGGITGFAAQFGIAMLMARAVASASLIFTGLTRLPMTAGWDNLAPKWFTRLHPRHRTPVNSIFFVAAVVMGLILLSLLGVKEQEASQLLTAASIVHYAIVYVALFALPIFGGAELRGQLPGWLKAAAWAGLISSLIALVISIYPIVDVVSRVAFAAKICAVVAISNMGGIVLYRAGEARSKLE
jgi:amino acid transporter